MRVGAEHLLERASASTVALPVVVGDLIGEGSSEEEAVTGDTPNLAAVLADKLPSPAWWLSATARAADWCVRSNWSAWFSPIRGFAELVAGGSSAREGPRAGSRRCTERVSRHSLDAARNSSRVVTLATGKGRAGQVLRILVSQGSESRLVLAPRERLKAEPITLVSYACLLYHSNSPLFPFILQLERAARFAPDDAPEKRLTRLELLLCEDDEEQPGHAFAVRRSAWNSERDASRPARTCLPSKGRRSCSGRSLAGSIDLQRVARS